MRVNPVFLKWQSQVKGNALSHKEVATERYPGSVCRLHATR
jgi:hypothetical protein